MDFTGDFQALLRTPMSRRRALSLGAAAGLAATGLGYAVGSQQYAAGAERLGLGLGPGGALLKPDSLPNPKLPAGTDTLPEIEHIVVVMMENHSFDDHIGMLGRGDGLTLGADGLPVNYNPAPAGGFIRSFHNPNTCGDAGAHISQSWDTSHICWDQGTNTGFVKGCSPEAMGYWTGDDLPFYYSMASQFPIGDRYFCSVMAQTYPNRRFLIAGTALGDISTNASGISAKDAPNGTIFDRFNHYGISWKDYEADIPTVFLFEPVYFDNKDKVVSVEQFFTDAASGNLPSFSLVDPYVNFSEESGDISVGEAYAALVIDAVLKSPKWDKTAVIWTYDEHGGWYDHVPPVPAVKPDNVPPELKPGDFPGAYDFTGFRVPCCVVSAWAKKDYVSHQVFDHTSILKLVETKWNLPALTFRDANARNMLDFFDFKAAEPPFAEAPTLAAPKNPFKNPAHLPPNSFKYVGEFHTICTYLPAGSLPPASDKLTSAPANADALLAAQQAKIAQETAAQDAELSGHPTTTTTTAAPTTAAPTSTRGVASGPGGPSHSSGAPVGLIAGVASAVVVAGGAALALRSRGQRAALAGVRSGEESAAGTGGDPEASTGEGPPTP